MVLVAKVIGGGVVVVVMVVVMVVVVVAVIRFCRVKENLICVTARARGSGGLGWGMSLRGSWDWGTVEERQKGVRMAAVPG